MTLKKGLIACCLGLIVSVVQAVTQEEQLELAEIYNAQVIQYYRQGRFEQARHKAEKAFQIRREILGEKHPYALESRNNLATIYLKLGRSDDALPLLETGYFLIKELAGEKHPKTLLALCNLAVIYRELGRLNDALSFVENCSSLMKEVLGEKHPQTLASLNGLAVIYQELGRLDEALSLFETVYSFKKEVLGEKHPSTLTSLNNLAGIYRELGRLDDVLPLAEKSYRLTKEVLDDKHPDTLRSLNNLAVIYQQLGRYQEALPLFKTSYRLFRQVLGEKHPQTITSLNNLAGIYQKLGRLYEALPLFETVYSFNKEVLGEKHPSTLTSLNNLAGIYRNLGRLDEVLPLAEKSHRLTKEVLGDKHPDTLRSLNNLAFIYQKIGRLDEALSLFKTGYSLKKKVLGEKHPSTLTSLNNLAGIYRDLGRLDDVLPLAEKSYRLTKEVLDDKHPDTLTRLNNLALIYKNLGLLDKALPLLEKSYHLTKAVLGEKHPDTLTNLNGLALIYHELGRLDEALPLFEKNYHLTKEVLRDEKHPTNVSNLNKIALCYQDLGRLDKALPLLEKAYRLSVEVLGEKHPETLTSLNNLVVIYQDLGRLDEYVLTLSEKSYHLSLLELGEKHPETLTSLGNLALFYQDLGRLKEALPLSKKAYRLSVEVLGEKHPDSIISLNNLALNYHNLGRLDEALPLAEKAYRLNQEILAEKHPESLTSLMNLAMYYALKGHIRKSVKHFEQYVAGVEILRRGDLSAENRQALFEQRVLGYFELSYLYLNQHRSFEAFRLAEMSKARTLLESLAAKLAAQQSGLTAKEQQQLQDSEARLAVLNDLIAKASEDNRLEEQIVLETEKNQRVSQFNQFHRELMEKYPKYAQLSDVQIISAQQGAKSLPANAVLISYLVAKEMGNESRVLAFTLQPDGTLTAHDLGKIPNLKTNVEDYQRQLSLLGRGRPIVRGNEFKKDRETLSRELGKQLLGPLSALIKEKSHWIISPDGPLALIPFETLRLEGEEQPVIAQHHITYVQSLSVLKLLQERDKEYKALKKRGTLLAMGAPHYGKNRQGVTTRSEITLGGLTENPNSVEIARRLVRSGDYGRAVRQFGLMRWRNLPGALAELEQLEALFKETQPAIYIQEQATEAQLQRLNQQGELANYRYLVFSAHGYLSPQVSALSSIVLGQVNNPPGIDGYVTAGEWPGYDLKSDLMVLSACETGRGEVVGGEGVMGLPYAFYVAGNKNTILTLWSISDKVTTEFVTSFFAKLKAGKGQLEALTATKREFIEKGGRHSNPAYWAAFVLYGV